MEKEQALLALLFYFSGSLNSTEEREEELTAHLSGMEGVVLQLLSARTGKGVQELQNKLLQFFNTWELRNNNNIVTNSRHYNALLSALEEINRVEKGLNAELSGDLLQSISGRRCSISGRSRERSRMMICRGIFLLIFVLENKAVIFLSQPIISSIQ